MIIPGVVAAYRANYFVPAACDDYWDDVVLLMHMDGADGSGVFVDEKGKTVTAAGDAEISTAQSAFSGGSSAYFDGNGDYLDVADSADFAFGTSDFTVELWLYTPPNLTAWARFIENGPFNATGGWLLSSVGADSDGFKRINFQTGKDGGGGVYIYSDAAIPTLQWVHIAVVRSTDVISLYVDGSKQSSTISTSHNFSSQKIRIASVLGTPGNYFQGYIDDLRITKGVARYTANFTPPTAPFAEVACGGGGGSTAVVVPGPGVPCEPNFSKMVLALHMNGADGTNTFTDETGKTPASLVNTPLIKTNNSKFGGASAYFDGKSAVVFGASADFALTKDFTVSFWLSPTYLGTQILGTGAAGNGFYVFSSSAYPGELTLYHAGAYRTTSGAALPINAWTHIEISRSGTSINLFVNGVSRLQYNSILPFGSTTAQMVVGSHYHAFKTPVSLFYGYLDDVFIMAGHAQHTSNFAVPVDPFGAACP